MDSRKINRVVLSFSGTIIAVMAGSCLALPKAFVAVPFTELVSNPIQEFFPDIPIKQAYEKLPVSGGKKNPFIACPRLHQLIFNETVEILEQRGEQVRILAPNFFFISSSKTTPCQTAWMLRKNLVTFEELAKQNLESAKIPQPLSVTNAQCMASDNVISLAYPYYDPITQQTFSAGTRFVRAMLDNSAAPTTLVYAFDKKDFSFKEIALPKTHCLTPATTQETKLHQFVQLLRQWTRFNHGSIPYISGGCSFTALNNAPFHEVELVLHKKKTSYYAYDTSTQPKIGLDCTGMIIRAAQLCGIPYFLKNSETIAAYLQPLHDDDTLIEGDLIWIPGHVMVISDLENNKLIEARGYMHGFGKVQEIALRDIFKDIETYQQIRIAYAQKMPLKRLNAAGIVTDIIPSFKLLKMASIWNSVAKTPTNNG